MGYKKEKTAAFVSIVYEFMGAVFELIDCSRNRPKVG
jgi:hypothetical protein